MTHHPLTWPIASYFVPAGTTATIRMTPTFSYATNGVLKLQPEERNCLVAVFIKLMPFQNSNSRLDFFFPGRGTQNNLRYFARNSIFFYQLYL